MKYIYPLLGIMALIILIFSPNILNYLILEFNLPYFSFECTGVITCYLATFNETLNYIVYFWLPLALILWIVNSLKKKDM